MGFQLHAIVAATEALASADADVVHPVQPLHHGLGLRAVRRSVVEDEPAPVLDGFHYLTPSVTRYAERLSRTTPCVYLEADFFGGTGVQHVVGWSGGREVLPARSSHHGWRKGRRWRRLTTDGAINVALRWLGVPRTRSHDEFETAGLGLRRSWDA